MCCLYGLSPAQRARGGHGVGGQAVHTSICTPLTMLSIVCCCSGPVVAMVWEGKSVVKYGRTMIGATNPLASSPGTIRCARDVCAASHFCVLKDARRPSSSSSSNSSSSDLRVLLPGCLGCHGQLVSCSKSWRGRAGVLLCSTAGVDRAASALASTPASCVTVPRSPTYCR